MEKNPHFSSVTGEKKEGIGATEFSQVSTLQKDSRNSNPLTSHSVPKCWVRFFTAFP